MKMNSYAVPLSWAFMAVQAVLPVLAATDISDTPLSSSTSGQVKPNVFFILDDSGSMDSLAMPDGVSSNTIGFRNNQCNTIYYNPAVTYVVPKSSAGEYLNATDTSTFTAAYRNGYDSYTGTNRGKINLSSSFRADNDPTSSDSTSGETARAAYYWLLNNPGSDTSATTLTPDVGACNFSTSSVTTSTTGICCKTRSDKNYNTCDNAEYVTGTTPACTNVTNSPLVTRTLVWKKVVVGATSGVGGADERENFANWYSYYRTRLMMMKAASGRAFFPLSDSYRVGFMTISPGTYGNDSGSTGAASGNSVSSSKFLKIDDFGTTHRSDWFTKLYSQATSNYTPLRSALSTAGRYYAGKNDLINKGMIPTAADDPVQYSCQQNFSILTTDGYWNSGSGRQIDGTSALGNQDGNLAELDAYNPAGSKYAMSPRPIYDGATVNYVWNTASNTYQNVSCSYSISAQKRAAQQQRCSQPQHLKRSTSSNYGGSWSSWSVVNSCTEDTSGKNQTRCSYDDGATRLTGTTDDPNYRCASESAWANQACSNTNLTQLPLCRVNAGAWQAVPEGSCAAAGLPTSPGAGGAYTDCQEVSASGYKTQYSSTLTAKTYSGPNQSGTQIGATQTSTTSWADWGDCQASAPTLPAAGAVTNAGPPTPPAGCAVWPCETTTAPSGGSSNSLADVAQYYYKTDLRNAALGNCTGALGVDVCKNNVPKNGEGTEDDRANWQHMTTFTMGLGLAGTLNYSASYKTDTAGAFDSLRKGGLNWPVPSSGNSTTLDDLWHAAVNGRGQFFSAKDPDSVVTSLQNALSGISARVASAAAAATSNLEPVAGDNFAYTAKYVTQKWTGELEAREIDLGTGQVNTTSPIWSAQAKLDALTKNDCDNRVIKLYRASATDKLVDFAWDSYACDTAGARTGTAVTGLDASEQSYFATSVVSEFSHYPNMSTGVAPSTVNQRTLAAGANLVNYIRGQRGKEGFASGPPATADDATKLYRARDHVLGDVINAQPVFVRAPSFEYIDPGYSTFKTANAARMPVVYVAANDGMLHAFKAGSSVLDTEGGKEAWAFIPSMVLPNLYKLADENYANKHQYLVDGTPVVADVFDTRTADCSAATPANPENCWKTILVAGLNKGGQGYYALDVSDPASPKALWEFKNTPGTCAAVNATSKAASADYYSDCNLGYTYGRPVVAKLKNGKWAVFVTSGYNNADGKGYLYVLEPMTGKIMYMISTGVGTAADPSGLNQINAWIEDPLVNNTVSRVYGVDLKGNIWRFDVNDERDADGLPLLGAAGREAALLAQVVDSANAPQPITTRPELAEVSGYPVVYVATGRYLGTTDTTNQQVQTVWAIKDPLNQTVSDLRSTLGQRVIENQGSGNTAYRTLTGDCATGEGWYADLPDTGERVNVDVKLQLGTLLVASNIPVPDACNIGGYSWLNYFNYKTGCAPSSSRQERVGEIVVGGSGTQSQVVGTNIIRLPGGKTVSIVTTSGAEQVTIEVPFDTPSPTGKRVMWREVVQ